MMFEFRTLFKVMFPHAYYASGFVENVEVGPSQQTANLLTGQNFLFRNQPGGFLVLARVHKDGEGDPTAVSIEEGTSLAFYFKASGETFYKVTQIPKHNGTGLYANNLKVDPTGKVKTGDWELLPYHAARWSVDLSNSVSAAGPLFSKYSEKLKNGKGVIVDSWNVKKLSGEIVMQSAAEVVTEKVDLNFSGLSEGGYTLQIFLENKQALPEYRFLYSETMDWSPTLGMYEWFPQPDSNRGADLISMDQSYEVKFEDVESYWRYFIVPSGEVDSTSFSVESETVNGVSVNFGAGSDSETPDGKKAVCFVSDRKIPLKKSPSGSITLRRGALSDGVQLPYVPPGYVKEKKFGKLETISEAYVYL